MAKSKCVPLKITAHLADGRFSSENGILMLDSILYHAWFIKYAPQVLDGIYDDKFIAEKQKYIGLPLKHIGGGRYATSKAVYEEIENHVEYYNKRPDFFSADKIGYLSNDSGIISDKSGIYRAYRCPQLVRTVKDGIIKFYAVGHTDKVQEMLNLILGVGKKTSMGFGFVKKWEVEEIDTDYTTEHPKYGLMRPIEVENSEKKYDCPVMMFGVKPPYWKTKNMRLCYVPV